MKLGAQFFTLRNKATTPEGLESCFAAMKEIGYEVAQMSAICKIEPERLKEMSDKYALPITCTHSPIDRILGDTDALIREHIIYGCPVIGLGGMPNAYRTSVDAVRTFIRDMSEPMKKIEAAGLRFAYHNHAFEFNTFGDADLYDILIEEAPTMNFILDTYWVTYAGRDVAKYVKLFGKERMTNVHFKDMKEAPKGPICPCGEGVIDFKPIIELCDSLGIPNALVEQDNAPDLGDEFAQMATSFKNLKPLF